MVSHHSSPGRWAKASFGQKLGWLLRDIAQTAVQQLFGRPRARRRDVYWSQDGRGNWVLHVPIYRAKARSMR